MMPRRPESRKIARALVYLVFQRQITEGVTAGSTKG
jgi:ABC-type maltose transport system permease subunit